MKKKLMILMLAALAAASLLALTACGDGNSASETESNVSSFEETASAESTLSSESLGIYVQDTDNDGTPDKVVDKDGNDLSQQYTLKEDGIYEGETLVLPMAHVQTYTALEGEVNSEEPAKNTEQPTEQPAKQPINTNVNTATNLGGSNTNAGTATKPQQQQTAAPVQPQPQVHAPIYTQQWVVDQAAWSEEVPVYSTQELTICNTCGASLGSSAVKHLIDTDHHGYHSETAPIQTGTKTIPHPEQGHYENVLVCGGCTGSH